MLVCGRCSSTDVDTRLLAGDKPGRRARLVAQCSRCTRSWLARPDLGCCQELTAKIQRGVKVG